MKKVLAFVLVLAMVLGSVSMAFAANTKYADDAAITNKEAVGVLSGLKVLEGDANGFRPADTLTRAEAAAIIARLLLGRDDADKLTASAALFTDVPANHWAAGYIAYCVSQGIIAGNGDGTFNPDGVLTVSAFGKMLLCALGYDAATEGLVGSNWEANTASLMVKANISVAATGACSRDTAALMALKTLEADMVEYATKGVSVNTGSAQVVVGGSAASKPAYANTYRYNNVADGIEQLAERVYKGKLQKTTGANDDFGRPGNNWSYTGSIGNSYVGNIGTFGKTAEKVFTSKMTAAQVNSELNGYKFSCDAGYMTVNNTTKTSDAAFTGTSPAIVVNGGKTANAFVGNVTTGAMTLAARIAEETGDGKLVEVYVDGGVITDFVEINYTLGQISSVSSSSSKTSYTIKGGATYYVYNDDTENTAVLAGPVAKNDWVTYVVLGTKCYIYPTTKVSGNQTSKSVGSSHTTIVVDGTTYTVGAAVGNVTSTFGNADDISLNLDQYGFAVRSTGASSSNYAYVANVTTKTTDTLDGSTGSAKLRVVFEDGTVGDYDLATKTSGGATYIKTYNNSTTLATAAATVFKNQVVTYTVNGSTITVEKVAETTNAAVTDGKYYAGKISTGAALASGTSTFSATVADGANPVVMNGESKFVAYNNDKHTAVAYTGATNVPSITAAKVSDAAAYIAVYKAGSVDAVKVVFIDIAGGATGKNVAYAWLDAGTETTTASGDNTVYSYTAYDAAGEKITVTYDSSLKAGGSKLVEIDANNKYTADKTTNLFSTNAAIVDGDVLVANGNFYTITDDTVTVLVKSGATKVDGNGITFVVGDTENTKTQVVTIYVTSNNEE